MKINRTWLFVAITSVALLIVLIIQVNWIVQTAKIREDFFNEKARLVLSKTAEDLCMDKETCQNLQICAGRSEVQKIDSLFNHYMKLYNIQIEYHFEIKPARGLAAKEPGRIENAFGEQPGCYKTCLKEEPGNKRMELKLVFPGKEKFILAEMGPMFITSVFLILVVLVLSWRTILSLMREKKISEHTTDFLNNMTHEFKTPLTNISLAGRLILKEANTGHEEKVKHFSGIILEENEKLRLQVEQVLSMTALERGEIPLQKTELDLHQVILGALKCMNLQIENRHGEVKLNLDAARSLIHGDRTHLTNALCNLIDNAVKYSVDKPELTILTGEFDEKIRLVITDKGIGIGREYQKRVFQKFFRVPTGDVHDVKGFGLGLAYVRRIVELHGGTIELKSEKGRGTSFIIVLPYV